MIKFAQDLPGVLGGLFTWIKGNMDWLKAVALSIGLAAGAWKAWTTGIKLWQGAVKIATAVQLAFNAATKANVIGLIVSALAALVAGLVYFFTQTELGQKIWKTAMDAIGAAFTWVWESVIKPVGDWIMGALNAVGAAATWLWENAIKPAFDAIGAIFSWIWNTIVQPYITLVVNYFRFWGAVFVWLWENAVKPMFAKIGEMFNWLWTNVVKPVVDWIKKRIEIMGLGFRILYTEYVKPMFDKIGAIFNWVWTTIIKPVVDWIKERLMIMGLGFRIMYSDYIKPAWDNVKNALHTGWTWINDKVFGPMKKGVELIKKGFKNGADGIATAWGAIKKAAAVPINFVLDTVWNNGIRKFWNSVVDELGLDDMKLPEAKTVKFASGGVMPGYTPGRDVHEFYSPTAGYLHLSGGEAIMRPEFTRAVGGKAGVDALNAKARRGEAFADGGVWGWAKDAWNGATNFAGDVWDNIKSAAKVAFEFVTDPIGAVKTHLIDGIIKPLIGGSDNLWLKTAVQLPLDIATGLGEKVKSFFDGGGTAKGMGRGTAGMGWQAMWNMVKAAIPGAVLTSSTRPAGTKTVNGGLSYHSQGRAIDVVPATMDTFAKMKALFPNARELIFSPAGGQQLLNGKPHFWGGAVRAMHWNHVHAAMANGGVVPKLYDQGGWMPHGGMGINLTGQPEAVLTPDESRALKTGLGGRALINGDVTFQSSGDFESDLDKLAWELRKLGRGSR